MRGKPANYKEPIEQHGVESWLQKQWMEWITKAIQDSNIKQASLAKAANINPSYINLMRKGSVPRRDVARRIGQALGQESLCMLMSGHIPHRGFLEALIKAMKAEAKKK